MKIFKFGGASVKSADGVRNLSTIVRSEHDKLFVIVSAMGKTTNALERLLESFYTACKDEALSELKDVIGYHNDICKELWGTGHTPERTARFYEELRTIVSEGNPQYGT